jgi:trk system potassium uptake protein TrkH
MNYQMILKVLGRVSGIEAALLLLPAVVALINRESVVGFLITIVLAGLLSAASVLFVKPKKTTLYAKEGFIIVALSWIIVSLLGALPFTIEKEIPSYIDALFETVSGFSTTGASILSDVEAMSKGLLFWRSFTHWIGGMGVLVFLMAVLPLSEDHSMHIMRAEVPGPTVGKLVPKVRRTSIILYLIYMAMTVIEVILLLLGGMPLFDALVHSFGTAGTGGFSIKALGIGYYNSVYIEMVISVFMLLFGINFNLYYLILIKKFKAAVKNEELLWFLGIVAFATVTIALNINNLFGGFFEALRYSFFQVSSIITTTGYATANFDLWPQYSRVMLVILMFIGACAGSTGGGMKVSRIMILTRAAAAELKHLLHPRTYNNVTVNKQVVDTQTVHHTLVYFLLNIAIIFIASLILSLENKDLVTTVTSVITCVSNIGPGLALVGPMGSFAIYSEASKLLLSLCMLIGRLEIYPILLLFSLSVWRKRG